MTSEESTADGGQTTQRRHRVSVGAGPDLGKLDCDGAAGVFRWDEGIGESLHRIIVS